ncbi:MAG: surface carbohydrate biosynthesis protein [Hyphomicrobiales bacterium]
MTSAAPLIIPVENQVRELDPKLLLACIAARQGFRSILGSHREVDFRIASFPRGLYLNKSMTERNLKMFQIMHRVGHAILTWDEEALVHLPPEIYYSRRLSPAAIRYVSHLFAWGENNADLWRRYPHLPPTLPIHVTGNPRNDMLRPELHSFYKDEVQAIRARYGDYLLVNTNFNHVNAFFPAQNLFKPIKQPGETPQFGKAGVGMTRSFAEALRDQKQAVFEAFQALIPELARAFPRLSIIVRPHPTESQDVYSKLAAGNGRIHVTNEGNVVPWLLGAKALVHNGCTTGVEAFVMRIPAFSFRPSVSEAIDTTFYVLPHGLSHQCFATAELIEGIQQVLAGKLGAAGGEERAALVKRYLTGQEGALACERMVDVLQALTEMSPALQPPPLSRRLSGFVMAQSRVLIKRVKSYFPGSHAPPEFHRHRYPGITIEELRRRIRRFQEILGDETPISAEVITPHIFSIQPTG